MRTGVEIRIHGMDASPQVQAQVRQHIERLEHRFGSLVSFLAIIDAAQRGQQQGKRFDVRLVAHLPTAVLMINREPGDDRRHEDVHVALRNAFDALERKIDAWSKVYPNRFEVHITPLRGRIVELQPDKDIGHIALTDGRLVHFDRDSVIYADFDDLSVDNTVALALDEAMDEEQSGLHASSVRPMPLQRSVDQPN